jgi:hypothetical protein
MSVILYSPSAGGLHLGPGLPKSKEVVNFVNGFATIEDDDPLKDLKLSWVPGAVGAYPGLRTVTEAERDAINALAAMSDADFERAQFMRTGRKNG